MTQTIVVVAVVLAVLCLAAWWLIDQRKGGHPMSAGLAWMLDNPLARNFGGARTTVQRMQLKPGQAVLEVGCGPGRIALPVAQKILPGGEVTAADIQPRMLQRIALRAQQAGVTNLRTVECSAAKLPLADASFDVVYLCTVLGEIPDRPAALAECYRVLKPGGQLSLTETIGDPHYQSRSRATSLATAAGFSPPEIQGNWFLYTANFRKPA